MFYKSEWECLYELNNKADKQISIACILAFYNGEKYFQEQIDSIKNQNLRNILLTVFISDDNSPDMNFHNCNFNFVNQNNCNFMYRKLKKNLGYSSNFLNALTSLEKEYDYYCFSDQDDIWYENKLISAVEFIKKNSSKKLHLYCARTDYYDEKCKQKLGSSPIFKRKPSFRNSLVQNIASGNTLMFNNLAKNVVIKSVNKSIIFQHDWWCYQLISGAGGEILYDKKSYLRYRQHEFNLIGSNNMFFDWLKRFVSSLKGENKKNYDINFQALIQNINLLTQKNKKLLSQFLQYRKASIFKRVLIIFKLRIYRQTLLSDFFLILLIILKKI